MSLGNIRVELELNDKNFTVRTIKAGETVRKLGRDFDNTKKSIGNIEKAVGGILPKLRDFAITASILRGGIHSLWQKSIIDTNAQIERMTFLLKGMSQATTESGRIKEAADDLEYLFDQAERAPFSLNEMTNSLVKMRSVGLEDARFGLESLTNAVAQFGGTDETLHRATIAIQQMAGKGVISMEELRQQLGEAVPTAIKLMARSMNLTYQQLVDNIATGRVEANDALKRMFAEMDRTMGGAAQNMMATWSGMVSRLSTRWTRLQVTVGNAGMFEAAKDALGKLIDELDPNRIEATAQAWGNFLGEAISNMVILTEYIIEHNEVITSLIKSLGALFIAYKVIGGVATFLGTTSKALGTYTAAQLAANAATAAMMGPTVAAAASMTTTAVAASKLSTVIGVLAASLRFLAGPWGIVIGLATAAGLAFFDFGNDVDRATEMVDKHALALDKDSKKTLESAIASKRALNEVLSKDFAGAQSKFDFLSSSGFSDERIAQAKASMDGLKAHYEANAEELADLEKLSAESQLARETNLTEHKLEVLRISLAKKNADLTASYSDESEKLAKALDAEEVTLVQYTTRKKEIIAKFYESQIEATAGEGLRIAEQMIGASRDDMVALQGELKGLKEIEDAIRKRKDEQVLDADREAKLLARKGGNSQIENFVTQTTANIAKLKADLLDGSTSVAKFEAMLKGGFYGEDGESLLAGGFVGGKDLSQIRAMLVEMDKYKEAVKEARVAERAGESLESLYRKSNQELATAKNLLLTGDDESFIDKTARRVDELLLNMPNATQEIIDMGEAIKSHARDTSGVLDAAKLIEETKTMNTEALDERQKFLNEFRKKSDDAAKILIGIESKSVDVQKELWAAYYDYIAALEDEYARNTETATDRLLREWEDTTGRMQDATADWLDDATDKLTDFIVTGKGGFTELVESILRDIVKLQLQGNISDILGGSGGGSGGSGLLSSLGGLIGGNTGSNFAGSDLEYAMFDLFAFAKGGIMSSGGSMPLNMYANGGVANTPQLAMFGEGRMAEAYVPLPDGRTIPVTMSGGGQSAPSVQVNVINQTSQEVTANQGQMKFDGKKMILDVVMSAAGTPGPFRDSMKGALR